MPVKIIETVSYHKNTSLFFFLQCKSIK